MKKKNEKENTVNESPKVIFSHVVGFNLDTITCVKVKVLF
jgi:hypothetical protein